MDRIDVERLEAFKDLTARKLRDVRCPEHHQSPRLRFNGRSLRDITITMSGCCDKLIALANEAIRGPNLSSHSEPTAQASGR